MPRCRPVKGRPGQSVRGRPAATGQPVWTSPGGLGRFARASPVLANPVLANPVLGGPPVAARVAAEPHGTVLNWAGTATNSSGCWLRRTPRCTGPRGQAVTRCACRRPAPAHPRRGRPLRSRGTPNLEGMPEFIYQMHAVRMVRGDKLILDDVTLAFLPGAKIGVVGPNGAGKSSLLKMMAGLEQPAVSRRLWWGARSFFARIRSSTLR